MLDGKRVLLTGGSGTLGNAIVQYLDDEAIDCHITIFSRDPMKHGAMKKDWPDLHYVIGDVRDPTSLMSAMSGHDFVLHAAAMKHIPEAEFNPDACFEVNVTGSWNVLAAATSIGIKDVMLISTDKACHSVNVYGATKFLMERLAFAYRNTGLNVYIPRYGNVIESTGSVVPFWKGQIENGQPISITDPEMTRFWLTPRQAVEIIMESLKYPNFVYVPKLPALSIMKLAEYTLGEFDYEVVGLRPGEKVHEELLTWEESAYASHVDEEAFLIRDLTSARGDPFGNYSSDKPVRELTREEVREMLEMSE